MRFKICALFRFITWKDDKETAVRFIPKMITMGLHIFSLQPNILSPVTCATEPFSKHSTNTILGFHQKSWLLAALSIVNTSCSVVYCKANEDAVKLSTFDATQHPPYIIF